MILEAHEKAATRFFNELFASPFAVSDAGVYAHHLIEKNFKASQISGDNRGLDTLLNLVRAFHIACNTSIKQLNESSASSTFEKGNAWTNWISRLMEILEAKLPVYRSQRLRYQKQRQAISLHPACLGVAILSAHRMQAPHRFSRCTGRRNQRGAPNSGSRQNGAQLAGCGNQDPPSKEPRDALCRA